MAKASAAKRIDPRSVSASGFVRWGGIKNADPDMEYRWAHPTNESGMPALLAEGWEPVPESQDGPRSAVPGIKSESGHVEQLGMVLMQMPKGQYRENFEAPAQARADQFDRAVKSRALNDATKSVRRRGVSAFNETEDTFVEKGV